MNRWMKWIKISKNWKIWKVNWIFQKTMVGSKVNEEFPSRQFCNIRECYRTLDKHQIKRWRVEYCLSIVLENNRCTGFARKGQLSWRLDFERSLINLFPKTPITLLFLYIFTELNFKIFFQKCLTNTFMKPKMTKTSSNKRNRGKGLKWQQILSWQYLSNIFPRRAKINTG